MLRTFQLRHIVYSITLFLIDLYTVTHSPAARCDTQPTPRHPSSCTFTQFTWCWPFRSPDHCPHIHDPLRATVTPVLWILFRLRTLSVTLRMQLGQCPVRDGWVHWISYYGCQAQDMPCVNDVVWWNITWHIQTQSTADLPTAVVAANTPPWMPGFARLTCPCGILAPQHTWRKEWRVLPV